MKKVQHLFFAVIVSISSSGFAQQAADTTLGWKNQIVGGVTLTQASFSNWEQGGENSLAWQVNLFNEFILNTETYKWVNRGKFELGFAKVAGNEARKSADAINIETILKRKLGKFLNPFVSATARTQFVSGFEYDDDNDTKTKISQFLDPGYFTQSIGLGYDPSEEFTTRLGFTMKETVTDIFPEDSKVQAGLTSVTEINKKLEENALFTSSLNLFSNFRGFDWIDVLWENSLTLKVTKYISVNVEADLLYDKDVTDKAQIKEILGVGFTYAFLE